MFAKRGRRDKPEGGLFHARDNHGIDITPDQPSVHTYSSRGTESKSVQGKQRRPVKKDARFRRHDKENGTLDRLPQENHSRRCNLRFDGLSEVDSETWKQTEKNVRRAMTTALELPEAQVHAINIESARAGATGGEEESASRHLCE